MLKKGDKVKYHTSEGTVIAAMDDMVTVVLADGKEYALPYDQVKLISGEAVSAPADMRGVMEALKPFIKNAGFLSEMAIMMSKNGVNELYIKSGKIAKFEAKESLEERIARHKADAIAKAEKEAIAEHQQEMTII